MSEIFFQDIDDGIGFGIQTCNVADVALFSSTGYDARVLLFTTNFGTSGLENINVGSAFGTSNYATNTQNEIYIGHITEQSNVQKVFVIHNSNVGINTLYPSASLQITSPLNGYGDAFLVNALNGENTPTFRIRNDGLVGVGTDPVTGNTMTVKGALQVDSLTIGGNVSLGNSSLITAAGIVTGGGYGGSNYLQFGNNSFCNLTNVQLQPNGKIITDFISPLTQPRNTIAFSGAIFSNISNIYTNSGSILTIDTIKASTNSNVNSVYIPLLASSNTYTSNLTTLVLLSDTISAATNTGTNSVNIPLIASSNIVATRILTNNLSTTYLLSDTINSTTNTGINSVNIPLLRSSNTFTSNLTAIQLVANLNVNNYSLCNIKLLDVATISNHLTSQIDFAGNTLCNVANIYVNGLNASSATINTLNSTTATIGTLNGTTANINTINGTYGNISNIAITSIASLIPGNAINAQNTPITNAGNLSLNSLATLNTNSINTTDGANNINFNNSSLTNVNNLTVNGTLTIPGEVIITNTSVTVTDQLSVENTGTGPALIVNQSGYAPIAEFMYNSNVVLMVKSGGQTLIGNFGTAIDANNLVNSGSLPHAQLYVANPSCNQDAMYIQQPVDGYNTLTLQGTSPLASNSIFFTASGKIGMGLPTLATQPNARIQIAQQADDTTDYLRLTSTGAVQANTNPFVVTSTGRVGIRTDPLAAVYNSSPAALIVAGTIQADNLILGGAGGGNTNLVTAYGMTPPTGTTYLSFGGTNLSNINNIAATQLQTTSLGSASAPAYTFTTTAAPNNAGIFAPSVNSFAIATAGSERLRVDNIGNVGIGVTNPQYNLDIGSGSIGAGSISANSFSGAGSNLTYLNASALISGIVPLAQLPISSLSSPGITQLVNSVSCNSTGLAATPNSVYVANSNANSRVSKSGGTMTGNLQVNASVNANYFGGDGSQLSNLNASYISSGLVSLAVLPYATIASYGITQLVDSTSCNSTSLAATTNSVYIVNSNLSAQIYTLASSTATAKASSNYTDKQVNAALIASSNYTDVQVSLASYNSSNYTDVQVSKASFTSSNYTDVQISLAFFASSNYTDVQVSLASFNSSNYTDIKASKVSITSSNYTDVQVSLSSFASSNYTDVQVSLASFASSNYTDTKASKVSFTSSNYTDVQVSLASFASSNYTDTRLSIASYDSSNYTNVSVSTASFASSNYTNSEIYKLNSNLNVQINTIITSTATASSNYTDKQVNAALVTSSNYANQQANTRVSKNGGTMTGNLQVNATVIANYFSGNGSNLTNLQTSQLIGVISTANLPYGNGSTAGIVKLSDSYTDSNDTADCNIGVTPYAVSQVYNAATSRVLRAGDNMSGNLSIYASLYSQNVGIGTGININSIPSSLVVGGGASIGSAYNSYAVQDGNLIIAGNVGMGTTNPQYELDIYGTLHVSGSTIFDGSVSFDSIIINSIRAARSNTINFTGASLCNISGINSTNITTPLINSPTNQVSFGYNRVLDVDSLIVRSNITVSFTGNNTYTNLPTDLVKIDSHTGKILDQYISSNIARLMADGTLNPAMIPVQQLPRSTLLRTTDKVGIGTRNPTQKLHVNNGNIALTGGRLGIGTQTTPLGALHIWDYNSGVPSFRIDNYGSYDTVHINGPDEKPLFYITANCNVGINTAAPQYQLDVNGTTHTQNIRTNQISSDSGTIDCGLTSFTNMQNLYVANLNVSTTMNLPATITSSTYTNQVYTNIISTSTTTNIQVLNDMHITGYNASTLIGLRVDNDVMAKSYLTISDRRVKNNIVNSDSNTDLMHVLQIPIHKYNFIDKSYINTPICGFIAQEIEDIVPFAVNTITHAIPSLMQVCYFKTNYILFYSGNKCIDTDLVAGSQIKVIHSGKELIRRVNNIIIINETIEIHLTESISSGALDMEETVFVYGRIVNDFKLINTERLMPLVFNSVKSLYNTINDQQSVINNILQRLDKLENK